VVAADDAARRGALECPDRPGRVGAGGKTEDEQRAVEARQLLASRDDIALPGGLVGDAPGTERAGR